MGGSKDIFPVSSHASGFKLLEQNVHGRGPAQGEGVLFCLFVWGGQEESKGWLTVALVNTKFY